MNGRYLFILQYHNNKFNCYASPDGEVRNHSHLAKGENVAGVGYLHFRDGKLTLVSNESGHYKPVVAEMLNALLFFLMQSKNPDLKFEVHTLNPDNTVAVNTYSALEVFQKGEAENKDQTSQHTTQPADSRYNGKPKQWRTRKLTSSYEDEIEIKKPLSFIAANTLKSRQERKITCLDGYGPDYDSELFPKLSLKKNSYDYDDKLITTLGTMRL